MHWHTYFPCLAKFIIIQDPFQQIIHIYVNPALTFSSCEHLNRLSSRNFVSFCSSKKVISLIASSILLSSFARSSSTSSNFSRWLNLRELSDSSRSLVSSFTLVSRLFNLKCVAYYPQRLSIYLVSSFTLVSRLFNLNVVLLKTLSAAFLCG